MRDRFPILENQVYFLNNAMGAAPRTLQGKVDRYVHEQLTLGERGWDVWWPWVQTEADRVAGFIGAPAGSVVFGMGVTELLHRFVSALAPGKVVTSALDFPSVGYAWQGWASRGTRVVVVPSPDGADPDEAAIIAAIDQETTVVSISLATYCSGALLDVARIAARARQVGAIVIVDAFQAYGVVPIDVQALGADVLISGTRKFGLGASESAFMYVRPALADQLAPVAVGWFGHREPFAFVPELVPAAGSQRFNVGTPMVLPHYAASAGLDVLLEVGIAAIREASLALTGRLIARADELGLAVATPREPGRRAGVVCLKFPQADPVHRQLNAEGFACSYRPTSGLRLGPHFFNTAAEADRLMDRLGELSRT
ncbi:MAG: Aminotransferase, class superfamily [Cyanobacteria bacterium RYN_339]|nr:Aminotransferase, class superfamily [Cyanobacteria bacterium RYN_339]